MRLGTCCLFPENVQKTEARGVTEGVQRISEGNPTRERGNPDAGQDRIVLAYASGYHPPHPFLYRTLAVEKTILRGHGINPPHCDSISWRSRARTFPLS